MKYIIIGLGNFGAPLAEKLTAQGNEVIGIDRNMDKVDALKEKISHTICMDAEDELTMSGLPLGNTDVCIVAIGEDQGANIMATAILKELAVKRLISRAINPLHEKVLKALGVDEIVHPEEETAERWSKKLCLQGVVDSFDIGGQYSIVEVQAPERYHGKTLAEIDLRMKYNILVLTSIKQSEEKSIIGRTRIVQQVQGVAKAESRIEADEILVVFGANKDIQAFIHGK